MLSAVLNFLPIVLFVLVLAGVIIGRRGIFPPLQAVAMIVFLSLFCLMLLLFLVMALRPHH